MVEEVFAVSIRDEIGIVHEEQELGRAERPYDRRQHLGGVKELEALARLGGRRVLLEGVSEESVQLSRRDSGFGFLADTLERGENPAEPLACLCRDADHRRVIEEEEVLPDHVGLFALGSAPSVLLADEIPFVEKDNAGLVRFLKHAGDAFILSGDSLGGIDYEQSCISPSNRFLGAHRAEDLHRGVGLGTVTESGSIHENVGLAAQLTADIKGVAGGSGDIANDAALLAEQPVQE